jgi:hypothetical protein
MSRDVYNPVTKPKHYNNGGVECIDYIKQQLGAGFKNYLLGNIIKYIHRHEFKDPGTNIQDLQKAKWYLEKLIDYYENL